MILRFSKLHIMDAFKYELWAGREKNIVRVWQYDLLGILEISEMDFGLIPNALPRCILHAGELLVGPSERIFNSVNDLKTVAILGRPKNISFLGAHEP